MGRVSRKLLHPLQNLSFRLFVACIQALPDPVWLHRFGRFIGHLSRLLAVTWRRRTRHNLKLILGDRVQAHEHRRILNGVLEQSSCGFCEIFWPNQRHGVAMSDWVSLSGLHHLDAALARGQGALLVTAHLGSWSLLPRWLQEAGYDVASLLRLPSNSAAHQRMGELLRDDLGLTCYGTPLSRADLQATMRLLRRNGVLFIVADRRVGDIRLDFLGHPAWCATGTASFHLRTGAAIVPARILRDGAGHRAQIFPELEWNPSGDKRTDERIITQRLHDLFGEWIMQTPEQWMWNHLRWRPRSRDVRRGLEEETR